MKTIVLLGAMALISGFDRAEGAFENVKPIQSDRISALVARTAYVPEEVGNDDLTEIYIAGALLSEGWGCRRDEKKALQLYLAALEVLRKEPMDMDVVWDQDVHSECFAKKDGGNFFNIYKAEMEQVRKPFTLYAMIGDTIRMLLQQGRCEEALQLMTESRRMSLLKGKMLDEVRSSHKGQEGVQTEGAAQIVHFYESMLSESKEEGYLLLDAVFQRQPNSEGTQSQASNARLQNLLIGELIVSGFEQKPEDEKLKAFPYVLRSARLGIPQAMVAMHLYYKHGCGFLAPNERKAKNWLNMDSDMSPSLMPSE